MWGSPRPRRRLGLFGPRRPTERPPSPTTSPVCASGAAQARSTRRRSRSTPARRSIVPSIRRAWRRQIMGITASGSRAEALRQVTVPTLVLHGSADSLIDPSGGRRTAELVPGARFVLIEGMGHDYPAASTGTSGSTSSPPTRPRPTHGSREVGLQGEDAGAGPVAPALPGITASRPPALASEVTPLSWCSAVRWLP